MQLNGGHADGKRRPKWNNETGALQERGGGGTLPAKPTVGSIDSGSENFSPIGDPAKHAAKVKEVEAEIFDECRWIINLMRASGTPETELLEEAKQMVKRGRLSAQKGAFEARLIERILDGELFQNGASKLVRAVLRRLQRLAYSEPEQALFTLKPGLPKTRNLAAQEELAQITAQFISTKNIQQEDVWPWLAKAAETEGFKNRWGALFRKADKPHERVKFEFTLSRLIALDEQMRLMARTIGPPTVFDSDEAFDQTAQGFVDAVRMWSPAMAEVLEHVKLWFAEKRAAVEPAYYRLDKDAWSLKRMEDPEACVDVVMPFLHAEWLIYREQNKARIPDKRPSWANVQGPIRNCAETIYGEFHAPPISLEAKAWLIPKYTGQG